MTRTVRRGFTLVELLVVMSLAIVLAGLAVAVAESGAFGSQKVVSAADRASGWLLIAKQRALRDQRPRGVRFLLSANATTGNWEAREAQYIEVPDAWVPDRTKPIGQRAFLAFVYTAAPTAANMTPVTVSNYGTKSPNAQRVFLVLPAQADQIEFAQRVSPGNLLTLPGSGATFRIDQMYDQTGMTLAAGSTPPSPYTNGNAPSYLGTQPTGSPGLNPVIELVLGQATDTTQQFTYPNLGAAASPTTPTPAQLAPGTVCEIEYNFAFTAGFSAGAAGTGGPLPLVGEPTLQLTGNTVIDVRRYPNTPSLSGTGGFNTTFGTVVGNSPDPPAAYPTTAGVSVSGFSTGTPFFDVLFSPSGQVLGASEGLLCLWIRDPDKTAQPRAVTLTSPGPPPVFTETGSNPNGDQGFDTAGQQVLVTVYTRTGLIATHPVLPPNGSATYDPFAAARDGLNSGL